MRGQDDRWLVRFWPRPLGCFSTHWASSAWSTKEKKQPMIFFCLHGRSRGASASRPRCCAAVLFLDQMRSNGLANKTRLGFRAFINRLQVKLPGTARGQKSKHTFFTVNFLTYVGYFFGLSKLLSFCKRYLLGDFIWHFWNVDMGFLVFF